MAGYNLRAKRSLGQHFLHDKNIADRIARAANVKSCNVVEIGPGPGSLTKSILEHGAKKLISIEKDRRCLKELANLATRYNDRLVLIEGDALEFSLPKIKDNKLKIVSNLPYNISVPLLIKYLQKIDCISQMTLMFQKEVADRLVAQPRTRNYGRLSIMAQSVCEVNIEFHVNKKAFFPPPKVLSTIVTFKPKTKRYTASWKSLEQVTKTAFGQRRKMLRSSLKTLMFDFDVLNINPKNRAQDLSIEQFWSLAIDLEHRLNL